jgi:hypothetical protein
MPLDHRTRFTTGLEERFTAGYRREPALAETGIYIDDSQCSVRRRRPETDEFPRLTPFVTNSPSSFYESFASTTTFPTLCFPSITRSISRLRRVDQDSEFSSFDVGFGTDIPYLHLQKSRSL